MQALTLFTLRVIVPPRWRSELIESLVALLEPTRVQPGCLGCRLYSDYGNQNAITLIGEWSSQGELERYLNSDMCKTLIAAIDLSTEPPQIEMDTIIRRTGLALVAGSDKTSSPFR